MTGKRLLVLIVAILTIALSWWGAIFAAKAGLVMRHLEREGVPLLYVAPENANKVPGILIAHGYAGSKQLMLGYAHVLAHAGYAVMLWDFDSHAANTKRLEKNSLQQNLDVAYSTLVEQPEVDTSRLGTLGHSMGSGAVMSAAIANVNRYAATVAVSPTGASVTPNAPRNLQLQAGGWEENFIGNARRLLEAGGGESKNKANGKGRELVIVPNAEHITILFRNLSHQAARNWFDGTFGVQRQSNYVDRRMIWYGLHLLGWLVVLAAIAPVLKVPATIYKVGKLRSWIGLLVAPLVACGTLVLINRIGDIDGLGGVLVGGAVSIWFGVAGLVWLLVLFGLPLPTLRTLAIGIGLFALLWIGFGLMAQSVWLQWWLIPTRLQLFPLLAIACLPWFLASGIAQQNLGVGKRILWWFGQSIVLVASFILVVSLLPQLGFIWLLLPVFPVLMVLFSFVAGLLNESWSYAIGCAMFFGWTLAAVFPLAS